MILSTKYIPVHVYSPFFQVGFINFICKPLYATLGKLLSDIEPLIEGCDINKTHWEAIITQKEVNNATFSVNDTHYYE